MPTVKLTQNELTLVLSALDQLPDFSDEQAELRDNLEEKLYQLKKATFARPPESFWAGSRHLK
jgi:hypothetical protein